MVKRGSGGRPSKHDSGLIEERILKEASQLFLAQGYGVTSIEKIATECGISKRTFYHRFKNKELLFAAVVHRLMQRIRPDDTQSLFEKGTLEGLFLKIADALLTAALSHEALALHRIMIAETTRFPELARVMAAEGSKSEAISRIAALLEHEARNGKIDTINTTFAAEQFLQMVMALPQRRAMGLGVPMTPQELASWKTETVRFFLKGCGASASN